MASSTLQLTQTRKAPPSQHRLVVCHCTTVHTQLKSRSYHRQFLPLARTGVAVRYAAPIEQRELEPGIKVLALPGREGVIYRLLAWPKLVAKLLRQRAHVYHFQDPQLLPVAFVFKLIFRKRVVYDAYEDFPAIAAEKRSIPKALRAPLAVSISCVENLAARLFDAIITADPLTLRRFARCGKSGKLVFYNFPNLDFFPAPRLRHTHFDLVYRGGLAERTGTFVLLDALHQIAGRPDPPRLLLIGYSDNVRFEESLRYRIRALGLESLVEIRGRIDHERMSAALGEARIGVSPLLPVRKFQTNIPVKIFEYWASGLPVVASDLAPTRSFFRHGDAGLLVKPGSATELAQSISWLLDHPDSASGMGQHGRQLVVQRFNNQSEVQKLRQLFARIAAPPQGGRL